MGCRGERHVAHRPFSTLPAVFAQEVNEVTDEELARALGNEIADILPDVSFALHAGAWAGSRIGRR
jgi:hypothetical protein